MDVVHPRTDPFLKLLEELTWHAEGMDMDPIYAHFQYVEHVGPQVVFENSTAIALEFGSQSFWRFLPYDPIRFLDSVSFLKRCSSARKEWTDTKGRGLSGWSLRRHLYLTARHGLARG